MDVKIKICGLKTPEAIAAAIARGADYIGFIFFEKSPRHLPIADAARLRLHIQKPVKLVAVTVNADDTMLDEIVEKIRPDILQLHGSETPLRASEIKQRYQLPIIKAFSIREAGDFDTVSAYKAIADQFLFDAKAPESSNLPGGNGVSFDWSLMHKLDETLDAASQTMLSGGLNAANVGEAIAIAQPAALDISSGVESAPGIKDVKLIDGFFDSVEKALKTKGD
ncbi:phosphoribosylanthranilate isomerase [Bartonella sp. LJL80]